MAVLHRKLLREFVHLRGQAVAIALVIACGVASFVTMRSMYRSLLTSQADYYTQYRFAEVFADLKRAPESVAARLRQIPGIAEVQTRVVMDATLDVPGLNEPAVGRLISIPERSVPMLNDLFIRKGRYVSPEGTDEVIASEAFTKANNLALGSELHAVINGRWKKFVIVGAALSPEYIYEIRGGGSIFPDNKRFGVLWMSRKILGPAFNMDGAFNSVTATLLRGASEPEVISRIDHELERYGGLGAYGRIDQVSHRFISDEISQNRISANIIPAIFLAVAALLVHFVLTRLVSTQRADIAILKAFGYSSRDVALHYVQFGLLVVTAGYILGCAVGWYFGLKLAALYAEFYRFPILNYRLGSQIFVWAAVITAATAIAGATGAVKRAVALPPAEAMRPEAPAHFHPTILDRLGLNIFSPALRMIVRNLERRPWKAIASVFAICCAVMMVVVEFGLFDAMDRMMAVQFHDVQREDVAVTLNEAHSARTRFEVNRLPGVIGAEPFRTVPVRLRYGHRSRRTAILGLPNPSELHVIVDKNGNDVSLPRHGLLLTSTLADLLGVVPGETLTVEVLDGKRPAREVVLAGTADELLGTSAYMNIDALNGLMQEDHSISGALLQVDAQKQSELYTTLKQLPAVSAVSIKSTALASFKDTINRSMALSLGTLIVFASVIAAGMIYNGARIALSERANELATLRILGFTRQEITVILLGEQALLTALALPFGFAAGYGLCALLSARLETELYRMPLVIESSSYAWAFIIVFCSAALSGFLVAGRLRKLDIVSVLKSRE
ncbi:MAG TPA: FtsX-like permease family protein [Candidatus Angelobacter sp.]